MRHGAKRNFITIQIKTSNARNAQNEKIAIWGTWREVWVEIIARRGREAFDAQGNQRTADSTFRFRGSFTDLDGISPSTMRVLHDGKIYDIQSVLPDLQRRQDIVVEALLLDGAV